MGCDVLLSFGVRAERGEVIPRRTIPLGFVAHQAASPPWEQSTYLHWNDATAYEYVYGMACHGVAGVLRDKKSKIEEALF